MNGKSLNKVGALFGLLLLFLFTYFRENFLLEINALMVGDEYNRAYEYWLYDFFKSQPSENLIKWKWSITISFSIVMSFLTISSLFLWFRSLRMVKIISYVYALVFSFVILLAVVGLLLGSFNDIYFVLRKLLGLVQSPLPFFIFFVLFYWENKKN